MQGMRFLRDNAAGYRSAVVQDYLTTQGLKTLPHPSNSPYLTPCDLLEPFIEEVPYGDTNLKYARLSEEL